MLTLEIFQQVILTPTHLAIVMEYAAGGELFDRIVDRGRFSEDEVTIYNHRLGLLSSAEVRNPESIYCFVFFSFFPLLITAGQIFLPAADLRRKLLPSHGMQKQ